MSRVKLDLPDCLPFGTELRVRISEINYGGHLGNDAVLSLAHEARVQWLKSKGLSEGDVGGCGLLMVDAVIVYKSQGFNGDRLRVDMAAAEPGRTGCDLLYRIAHAESGAEVARVKTGMVFFDYAAGKVVRMPDAFRAAFFPAGA